ncbi:MAG: PH domain-containing protein [Pseudomonadota bacterium]|nr:PH domain-containing protein [Pseudomonadota bacterium]
MDNYDIIIEKDEDIILKINLHWIFFKTSLISIIFSILVIIVLQTIPFFSMPVFFGFSVRAIMQLFIILFVTIGAVDTYLNYQASFYMITNRRVIISSGWIIKNTRDILLTRIEGVQVRQNITGRIFNFGSIVIYGMGTCVDRLPLLPDPFGFRAKIQEQMSLLESKI